MARRILVCLGVAGSGAVCRGHGACPAAGAGRLRAGDRAAAERAAAGRAAPRRRRTRSSWLLMMFYLWTIWRRLGKVEAEMHALERRQGSASPGATSVTAGHFIFIPSVLLVGIVIGWILGSRAARDAYAAELRRRDEKAARAAERAGRVGTGRIGRRRAGPSVTVPPRAAARAPPAVPPSPSSPAPPRPGSPHGTARPSSRPCRRWRRRRADRRRAADRPTPD